MATFIAVYGTVALAAAVLAGIIAAFKRRDWSYWATMSLLLPPMLLVLLWMPKNAGPRPRRVGMEEEENRQLSGDERY